MMHLEGLVQCSNLSTTLLLMQENNDNSTSSVDSNATFVRLSEDVDDGSVTLDDDGDHEEEEISLSDHEAVSTTIYVRRWSETWPYL